jgi:dTDP-4-dehydrorhamnose 3,5-epimerase-like enzyme
MSPFFRMAWRFQDEVNIDGRRHCRACFPRGPVSRPDSLPDCSVAFRRHQQPFPELCLNMSLNDCKIIELPKISDPRGNLTFIEGGQHIPFDIKRVYYLYDVPGGAERGGHAHKALSQLIVAMSGSFDVILDEGGVKKRFHLNRSYQGLYVCPMMWRELDNFSSGSVCMVLASNVYDEADYYRDYNEYKRALAI